MKIINLKKLFNFKKIYYRFKYKKMNDFYLFEIIDLLNDKKIVGTGIRNFYDLITYFELLPYDTGFYVERIRKEDKNNV